MIFVSLLYLLQSLNDHNWEDDLSIYHIIWSQSSIQSCASQIRKLYPTVKPKYEVLFSRILHKVKILWFYFPVHTFLIHTIHDLSYKISNFFVEFQFICSIWLIFSILHLINYLFSTILFVCGACLVVLLIHEITLCFKHLCSIFRFCPFTFPLPIFFHTPAWITLDFILSFYLRFQVPFEILAVSPLVLLDEHAYTGDTFSSDVLSWLAPHSIDSMSISRLSIIFMFVVWQNWWS